MIHPNAVRPKRIMDIVNKGNEILANHFDIPKIEINFVHLPEGFGEVGCTRLNSYGMPVLDIFVTMLTQCDVEETYLTIAHEFVHYNQIYRGHILFEDRKIYWHGKDYTYLYIQSEHDKGIYLSLPWEVEAYAQQEELAKIVKNLEEVLS